jgi:hypothetical protein
LEAWTQLKRVKLAFFGIVEAIKVVGGSTIEKAWRSKLKCVQIPEV